MDAGEIRRGRLRRNLRTVGLALLLAAAGAVLILQGGALGIFFGIPLGAGGLVALVIGLVSIARGLIVPPRRFACPRCKTEQEALRDLPWAVCTKCGLPLVFLGERYLSLIHCGRCGAEFGVGARQDAPVACPDCGQLHLVTGGEVQPDGENREALRLEDFTPDGLYSGERGELRVSLVSGRGRVLFPERIAAMLAEKSTAVVWGELVARTRALRLAFSLLAEAAGSGDLESAPAFWPVLRGSTVNTVYAWARYLELTGAHEFRPDDVPVEFPLGEIIECQHDLARLPGFGEKWDLGAAALEERPRWLGAPRLVLDDFRALTRLARQVDPEKGMPSLDSEERTRLLDIFSLDRLSAGKRRRVERALGDKGGRAAAFCDLSYNGSARSGLVLLDDDGLAAYNKEAVRFYAPGEVASVYFTDRELVVEPVTGEAQKIPAGVPRERRSFLLLIQTGGERG
jgi:DNA-directed RNA polymerase subunit RPC12/RpoP